MWMKSGEILLILILIILLIFFKKKQYEACCFLPQQTSIIIYPVNLMSSTIIHPITNSHLTVLICEFSYSLSG